ncbi:MAG: YlxR family protein [Deltaproteobacteria bacterium]|nr:YlxR family protein [Deltaproteobacteria bacterium]
MTKVGHTPLRRCLGCRKRRRKDELIRMVSVEGRSVVVDVVLRMSGRGAYLCNDDRCLRIGLNAKAISNAFRKRVVIDENLRKSIETISQKG